MVEQKKIIKEDVFEKKKLGSTMPSKNISNQGATLNQSAPMKQSSMTGNTRLNTGAKQFTKPGRVSDITKQENILLKNKPIVEEVHEKPIVEVHEKPIIKNVKEQLQTKYVKEPTLFQEVGNKVQGAQLAKEKFGNVPNTKKIHMKPKISTQTEAPIIHKQDQVQKEIYNQPVIHEIHEKPIQEIHEQNIVRVVHEKPEVRKVKDAPVFISEDKNLKGTTGLSGGNLQQKQQFNNQKQFGGGNMYDEKLQTGELPSGKLGYDATTGTGGLGGKPKTMKSNLNKEFGGKNDWKKDEIYKDEKGDLYKKEYKHREFGKKLPTSTIVKKDRTWKNKDLKSGSPYSSPSTPSSPSSPSLGGDKRLSNKRDNIYDERQTTHKGGKMHNLKEKVKEKLHIGDTHKRTY